MFDLHEIVKGMVEVMGMMGETGKFPLDFRRPRTSEWPVRH